MEAGKKTSQTRLKLSHHGLLDSPNPFALTSERPNGFFVLLMRAGLLLCLVGSIILAFHSTLSTQTRRFRLPVHDQEKPPDDISPTNITHIQFGIGGSVRTWPERSSYGELWWVDNSTRGFVWLDKEPGANKTGRIPYRVSEDWTRFRYSSSQAAVRIARIVLESFRVGLPKVRWFVMGDDDTVFFTDNLVTVLASYDHNQMYYIGGNSESIEQDAIHAYGMAFGGGGFAISYALAAQLVDRFDGCLDRYWSFYGSDQRVWACVSELGVPLTKELGFHQVRTFVALRFTYRPVADYDPDDLCTVDFDGE